jgi:hypothetical protein
MYLLSYGEENIWSLCVLRVYDHVYDVFNMNIDPITKLDATTLKEITKR